jgi:hypothetical protein
MPVPFELGLIKLLSMRMHLECKVELKVKKIYRDNHLIIGQLNWFKNVEIFPHRFHHLRTIGTWEKHEPFI